MWKPTNNYGVRLLEYKDLFILQVNWLGGELEVIISGLSTFH